MTASHLFTLPIHGDNASGKIVATQPQDGIYLLTFSYGPDNRLVSAFCNAFILALDIIETRYAPGVVITTSGIEKFYSNGMDLDHALFTRMFMPSVLYKLWRRLLTYGMPTVALVNGHAFAGGAMVAMMHDYRVMNPHKGFFSLNELDLGVPLKPPMTAVFRMKLSAYTLRKLVLEAHRYKALEALKEGIVDHLGGLDETIAFVQELKLVDKAQTGLSGHSAYAELKIEMWRETVDYLDAFAEEHVRDEVMREKANVVKDEAKKRVDDWEKTKAKL